MESSKIRDYNMKRWTQIGFGTSKISLQFNSVALFLATLFINSLEMPKKEEVKMEFRDRNFYEVPKSVRRVLTFKGFERNFFFFWHVNGGIWRKEDHLQSYFFLLKSNFYVYMRPPSLLWSWYSVFIYFRNR